MKVFKNKNRGKQNQVKAPTYMPEYERLNKEPVVFKSTRELGLQNFPKQVKVNSGQNQEAGFIQAGENTESLNLAQEIQEKIARLKELQSKQVRPVESFINKIPVSTPVIKQFTAVNSYYDEPLSSSAVPDLSMETVETINDDEVQLPNRHSNNHVESENDDSNELFLGDVKVGEFVVLYDNDMLYSGTLEETTIFIETILTSDEYNVDADKLFIFKRMKLHTGVLISE